MKKIIFRLIISLVLIVSIAIIYLSTIGIKTEKFNNQIISKVREFDPNYNLKINQVSAKLKPLSLTVEIKTLGTDFFYKKKIIELENIRSKISLKSLFNNQFALSEVKISSKSVPIKNLINLIRAVKNDPKLFIAEQFIKDGYIIADLDLEFNEFGNVKKNFTINGLVNNAKISLLDKKISKLNFIFKIKDKELNFENIKFLLNNKNLNIPILKAEKKNSGFFITGKLKKKDLSFKKNEIKKFTNNEFLNANLNNITFDTDVNFNFFIDKNFKFKDLDITSTNVINKLEINNFLEKKNFLPNIKNNIIFEDQKIDISYNKSKIEINGSGKIFIQDNPDIISYKVVNKKDNYFFDLELNIIDNPVVVDLINFEKKKQTSLNFKTKGFLKKNNLEFDEIILLENENILSIKNLKLTNDYRVEDIENIKFYFEDKSKQKNDLELIKNSNNYSIIGKSFNADKLITELLSSKKDSKRKVFSKNFDFKIDIKKVYLDRKNSINNFQGIISFSKNKVVKLNLEALFSKKKKITMTIKENNDEKITTIFSGEAEPIVSKYEFVKGFSEGKLDFYSIKRNDETEGTLKIYDFKLNELPALTKVLTLASLQGIADLLSGEGIRFSEFEMNFNNNKNLMTIKEIYALGPAISILMDGYIEKSKLVSLKGTLVPATTINKVIGSIPLIGDFLVGKKVGEGVFGVSFKIKGPPKDLETSVNPIKTLTPRFITRTLEKIKKN